MITVTEDWIKLDIDDIVTDRRADPAVGHSYFPSPYNLPTAIRISAMPTEGKRVIEFQYLDGNEPAILRPDDGGVGMALGKKSHRVFRVFVSDPDFLADPKRVISSIINAILNLRDNNPRSHDNLDATSHVVSRLGEKLLQQ